MDAEWKRGQHRQSLRWRLAWHSDERCVSRQIGSVGGIRPNASRMAVQAARIRLYLSRTLAAPNFQGSRSGQPPNHGVSRGVAAIGGRPHLLGWAPASLRECASHLGRIRHGGVGWRHAEDHDDSCEGRIPAAQRRAAREAGNERLHQRIRGQNSCSRSRHPGRRGNHVSGNSKEIEMRNLFNPSMVLGALLLTSLVFGIANAQQRGQQANTTANTNAQLEVLPIRGNLYMLAGAGGNIALSVGPDGVLMVDTGALQNGDKVLAAVQQLQRQLATNGLQPWTFAAETRSNLPRMISPPAPPKPIRYIINTSLDADHTGGNEKLSQAGKRLTGVNVAGNITDAGEGAST